MEKIKLALEQLGLTAGEIRVYLALLELRNTTIGPIIEHAKVSNSKIYIILDRLIEKGLASYVLIEKTKYFQPSQPVALLDYLDKKTDELERVKKSTKEIVKLIEQSSKNEGDKDEARIYKGYKGLQTGLFEAVQSIPDGGRYCFFSIGYGEEPRLKKLFTELLRELNRRKINTYGIAHNREKKLYASYYDKIGYNMRYTDIQWPADTAIVGDYVTLLVWKEAKPILYSIHGRILVASYLSFFESMWRKAST